MFDVRRLACGAAYYQLATVALNIWSARSFTICATSSSCTDARLCVVSYDLLAVNCRSKS